MSKVLVKEATLTSIADAIREKNGSTDTYYPNEMAAAISKITTGNVDIDLPETALTITGACSHRFFGSGWNWFIDTYGEYLKTDKIISLDDMFYNNREIEYIPFDINCYGTLSNGLKNMFYECKKLKELPKIKNCKLPKFADVLGSMLQGCSMLREIPDDYFDDFDFSDITDGGQKFYYISNGKIFYGCNSLRKIPLSLFKKENPISNGNIYSNMFYGCYVLDEIKELPIPFNADNEKTSSIFNGAFPQCYRLKALTFEKNEDGTPKIQSWKSQTIDLSSSGFGGAVGIYTDYNSGITADKEVKSAETYNQLKNDNDWFTTRINYSRYNHDSAVETINTLPDTSAYLATAGGTNTIKFKGAAGSSTDGGAINTMTEEEIAVATAKGWTVSFV